MYRRLDSLRYTLNGTRLLRLSFKRKAVPEKFSQGAPAVIRSQYQPSAPLLSFLIDTLSRVLY